MTLSRRDTIAAHALQALIVAEGTVYWDQLAFKARQAADALIVELDRSAPKHDV